MEYLACGVWQNFILKIKNLPKVERLFDRFSLRKKTFNNFLI
jgi:hypothetical protein